ncbi:MFS transporter [Kitasatospora kifunensis]|uniref:MFS family permease n=1 Tax=Kitasatospora kifunensis TaxID=58351 RepID=A0A7W7QYE2_KITKI|nr:MFS transporter [Kitasatospora kifunensis]MBB4921799.1 MFS family permease [Kitasatospora kifunensis]
MPLLNKIRRSPHPSRSFDRPAHPTGIPATRAWSRARLALTAIFAVDGFLFAAWVVRIPDIRAQVHASHAALGLALLCLSAGAVATMPLVGRLCLRFGSRPITVLALTVLSGAVLVPPHTHSVLTLGAALLLFGAGYGAANVAMNSVAVELVTELRRPVMPSFHAGYSLGGLLGAAAGGLLAGQLTASWALACSGALGVLVTAGAGAALLRDTPTAPVQAQQVAATPSGRLLPHARLLGPVRPILSDQRAALGARLGVRPSRPRTGPYLGDSGVRPAGMPGVARPARSAGQGLVVLVGLTAMCSSYGEGSLADWATLHLTDDVHASATLAAFGYAAYAFAMTAGRLAGTWLSIRLGPARLMTAGGLAAGIGMLIAALVPWTPVVLGGFVLVGLGLANLFPLAIAKAGESGGPRGVATASTLGYAGMLIGPPVIGFLADAASLPIALTTVAAASAGAAVLALVVHRPGRALPGTLPG